MRKYSRLAMAGVDFLPAQRILAGHPGCSLKHHVIPQQISSSINGENSFRNLGLIYKR